MSKTLRALAIVGPVFFGASQIQANEIQTIITPDNERKVQGYLDSYCYDTTQPGKTGTITEDKQCVDAVLSIVNSIKDGFIRSLVKRGMGNSPYINQLSEICSEAISRAESIKNVKPVIEAANICIGIVREGKEKVAIDYEPTLVEKLEKARDLLQRTVDAKTVSPSAAPSTQRTAPIKKTEREHLADVATACIGEGYTETKCKTAMSTSNRAMAAQYSTQLLAKGHMLKSAAVVNGCAAASSFVSNAPMNALVSAYTECANIISNMHTATNIKPEFLTLYQLMVEVVQCKTGVTSCQRLTGAIAKFLPE